MITKYQFTYAKYILVIPLNQAKDYQCDEFSKSLYPPNNEVVGGYIGFRPSVHLSVHPLMQFHWETLWLGMTQCSAKIDVCIKTLL